MYNILEFNEWIACPKPNPKAYLRLFCFPYAGGGASEFRTWAGDLPAEIEVCAVQLPGREKRFIEPARTELASFVQELACGLKPYLDIPFSFFGHSMGALISFELAHYLFTQRSRIPVSLFVSAHRAPQLLDRSPSIHHLPAQEFIERLVLLYGGIPQEALENAAFKELMLPLLKADFTLVKGYTCKQREPLPCHIRAFGGLEDESVTRDEMAAWREQTSSTFRLQMLPGNHFFLRSARAMLLEAISEDLLAMGLMVRK